MARQLYLASLGAVEHVRNLIRYERIACDFEPIPHLKLALTTRQAVRLRKEAETLARLGFAAEYLDAAGVAALAPIPARAGICYPQGGQLNPALLARGLKRAIIERGVQVHENTPIRSLTPAGGGTVRLDLVRGSLTARRVVLATNAHTPQLGVLGGQVVPIQTHVSLTAPLTARQLSTLAWEGRRSLSDKRHIFNYYRLTKENRIMFGGGRPVYRPAEGRPSVGATDLADPRIWRKQRRDFAAIFPTLAGVDIEKQWSGTIGMTLDKFPMIGALETATGVFFAGGWSGHGVGMATASGALIADLLFDRWSWKSTLPWNRSRAPRVPADPLRSVGLSAYLSGLQWADRLEAIVDRYLPRPLPVHVPVPTPGPSPACA
jgi:gamma-glutamylputrescine oxidase